jgi:hypothetical protein
MRRLETLIPHVHGHARQFLFELQNITKLHPYAYAIPNATRIDFDLPGR